MEQAEATLSKLAPTARLTLELLGPAQIARDGLPLTFTYAKVQALLVYLAVEAGRAHRRTALAELLWPEQDEAAARHNLSQALFILRRARWRPSILGASRGRTSPARVLLGGLAAAP